MTWHTPSGDRYLAGEEAELVRDSIATMVEELASCRETEDEPWRYGVCLFDDLTWSQQLAVLDLLASYLLLQTETTLELSGVNEAGVAAIYRNIAQQIELEIELQPVSPPEFRFRWRSATLAAFTGHHDAEFAEQKSATRESAGAKRFDRDHETAPRNDIDPHSTDVTQWESVIDCLADRVLWDRDFEMVNEMIDAPPERAAALRAALGIQPSYYTAIAPDPTEHQIDALFESLGRTTRPKPR